MIVVLNLMKRKFKRIFLEVISNIKNSLYKILFNEIVNDLDFAKLTGGTRQRGRDCTTLNMVIKIECFFAFCKSKYLYK